MPEDINAEEYREAAKFIENAFLEALTTYADISFTPAIGDLYNFPRPTTEARAAQRGLGLLRQQADEVVAILHALAAAADNRLPVPSVLKLRVEPYVQAFRTREQRPLNAEGNDVKGQRKSATRKGKKNRSEHRRPTR